MIIVQLNQMPLCRYGQQCQKSAIKGTLIMDNGHVHSCVFIQWLPLFPSFGRKETKITAILSKYWALLW
jgi:hypothetical protein